MCQVKKKGREFARIEDCVNVTIQGPEEQTKKQGNNDFSSQ